MNVKIGFRQPQYEWIYWYGKYFSMLFGFQFCYPLGIDMCLLGLYTKKNCACDSIVEEGLYLLGIVLKFNMNKWLYIINCKLKLYLKLQLKAAT